jgi:hypothetical protein
LDAQKDYNEILGLFDAPAFARRALELEELIARLHDRCRRAREQRLEMVRVRLRQWAAAAPGPEGWEGCFAAPIDHLWDLSGTEAPAWAERPAPSRRRRAIARDLVASLIRFNRRWAQFLDALNLDLVNRAIDQYNRYYTFEKECVMGSARLAARHFVPRAPLTRASLLTEYPALPVPDLSW